MTDKKPTDMVVALRQLAESVGQPIQGFPKWFQEEFSKDPHAACRGIYLQAAEELENMQKLNGRLYKTLYGD